MSLNNNAGIFVELKISGDGSHTLFVPGLNERYHSVFGAVTESRHIFIEAGYRFILNKIKNPVILEIGLGTGLNSLLTFIESTLSGNSVAYTAIEPYPLESDIISRLNYPQMIPFNGAEEFYKKIHTSAWNRQIHLAANFTLIKLNTTLEEYEPDLQMFDLVYFDAFGPEAQPEMWTLDVFKKMASCLKSGGVLVTYSTKGTVKRNLKEAGFSLEKLPGPAGKREILRAEICSTK
jgi:tRNA U34 5-methylaminomethyl-2-thiouridine-forming methyltransferase MnmC